MNNIRSLLVGRAMVAALIVILLVIGALFYKLSQAPQEDQQRLTAEQVVDLEVQAEQEYLQAQGKM